MEVRVREARARSFRKEHLIGCGIYNMQMDKSFIEDVVNRAATLVEDRGKDAFPRLRDKTGPFVFMDTYVFVDATDGTELVNVAQPTLEGKSLHGVVGSGMHLE